MAASPISHLTLNLPLSSAIQSFSCGAYYEPHPYYLRMREFYLMPTIDLIACITVDNFNKK